VTSSRKPTTSQGSAAPPGIRISQTAPTGTARPFGLDDESDGLPHPAAHADGFEIAQELDAAGQAHPSSPRSI
jgi:hypothetical protein